MIKQDLPSSIIQIRHVESGVIVGTGFVISDRLVITCAHVVENAGGQPGDRLAVVFHATGESRSAEVVREAWRSPNDADIALLRLADSVRYPIVPLTLSEAAGCDGHRFRTFGYPNLGTVEGVWATGEIKGIVRQPDGRRLLQLSSSEIDQGLSGGPVFDVVREAVVGIVTEVYYPGPSTKHRDTGLATPAEAVSQVYPGIIVQPAPLRELIVVDGRLRLSSLRSRQTWARLLASLRRWIKLRPVQFAGLLVVLSLIVLLAVNAVRNFQNRDWQQVTGGQALLGQPDKYCSRPADPFEIQLTEVTNAEYLRCVRAGVCGKPQSNWQAGPDGPTFPPGRDQHPVFGLTWQDADAYCHFIGARLPTEAEWVRAARGSQGIAYPWGDTPDTARTNAAESKVFSTVAVASYPDGRADNIYQMSGNVREWVADSAINACDPTQGDGQHVAKGGSFADSLKNATLWFRFVGDSQPYVGLRCARDIRP